jgi:hypothetical protein
VRSTRWRRSAWEQRLDQCWPDVSVTVELNGLGMRMLNIRKRIEALEKSLPPQIVPDSDDETMDRALAAVSEEDREVLMRIGQGRVVEEGGPRKEWADRETAALDAFGPIVERESRRAGYRSTHEFVASYCGGAMSAHKGGVRDMTTEGTDFTMHAGRAVSVQMSTGTLR